MVKFQRSGPSCSKRHKFNELVKGHFVNCFSGFNIQYSDIFSEKLLTFFSKKFQHICVSLDVNFNNLLTNDVVSFEQLGPAVSRRKVCHFTGFDQLSHITQKGCLTFNPCPAE